MLGSEFASIIKDFICKIVINDYSCAYFTSLGGSGGRRLRSTPRAASIMSCKVAACYNKDRFPAVKRYILRESAGHDRDDQERRQSGGPWDFLYS